MLGAIPSSFTEEVVSLRRRRLGNNQHPREEFHLEARETTPRPQHPIMSNRFTSKAFSVLQPLPRNLLLLSDSIYSEYLSNSVSSTRRFAVDLHAPTLPASTLRAFKNLRANPNQQTWLRLAIEDGYHLSEEVENQRIRKETQAVKASRFAVVGTRPTRIAMDLRIQ